MLALVAEHDSNSESFHASYLQKRKSHLDGGLGLTDFLGHRQQWRLGLQPQENIEGGGGWGGVLGEGASAGNNESEVLLSSLLGVYQQRWIQAPKAQIAELAVMARVHKSETPTPVASTWNKGMVCEEGT